MKLNGLVVATKNSKPRSSIWETQKTRVILRSPKVEEKFPQEYFRVFRETILFTPLCKIFFAQHIDFGLGCPIIQCLAPVFVGRSKTTLICTASPDAGHEFQTKQIIEVARAAAGIKCRAIQNNKKKDSKIAQLHEVMKKLSVHGEDAILSEKSVSSLSLAFGETMIGQINKRANKGFSPQELKKFVCEELQLSGETTNDSSNDGRAQNRMTIEHTNSSGSRECSDDHYWDEGPLPEIKPPPNAAHKQKLKSALGMTSSSRHELARLQEVGDIASQERHLNANVKMHRGQAVGHDRSRLLNSTYDTSSRIPLARSRSKSKSRTRTGCLTLPPVKGATPRDNHISPRLDDLSYTSKKINLSG